jgi:hypothetical protein
VANPRPTLSFVNDIVRAKCARHASPRRDVETHGNTGATRMDTVTLPADPSKYSEHHETFGGKATLSAEELRRIHA